MTPADRQRLKRQRRAEAGMVKVEVWLDKDTRERLKSRMDALGPGYGYTTVSASILHMIRMDLGLERL